MAAERRTDQHAGSSAFTGGPMPFDFGPGVGLKVCLLGALSVLPVITVKSRLGSHFRSGLLGCVMESTR